MKIVFLQLLAFVGLKVKGQEMMINNTQYEEMSTIAIDVFHSYKSFHYNFFETAYIFNSIDCENFEFETAKELEKEKKYSAYSTIANQITFLKGALAFKEESGNSFDDGKQSFSNYLLTYFDVFQKVSDGICEQKSNYSKIKYLAKAVKLDSVGLPFRIHGEGLFIPIHFKSIITYLNRTEVVYSRVLTIRIGKVQTKLEALVYHVFNSAQDWRKFLGAETIQVQKQISFSQNETTPTITLNRVPIENIKAIKPVSRNLAGFLDEFGNGDYIPTDELNVRRLNGERANEISEGKIKADKKRGKKDPTKYSRREALFLQLRQLKSTEESLINNRVLFDSLSPDDYLSEENRDVFNLVTENCDTIKFPAIQIAQRITADFAKALRSLSDPNSFGFQNRDLYDLNLEFARAMFTSDNSPIEFWNYGESSPIVRTVDQYFRTLRTITTRSGRENWYSYINVCIPSGEIRVMERVLTSPRNGMYKYSIIFNQYFLGLGDSKPTYRDRILGQMNIVIPVVNCQYGKPKISAVLSLQEPEIFDRFPPNVDCL